MQKLPTAVALLLGMTVSSAFADVPALGGIFAEGAFGNVEYGVPDNYFNFNDGFSHATGLRALVGVNFKREDKNRVSAEAFASSLRPAEVKETYTDAIGTYEGKGELSMNAVGGGLRLGKSWQDISLYGRAGVFRWTVKGTLSYSGSNINTGEQLPGDSDASENGLGVYGGLGAQWFLTSNVYLGAEWTYYPVDLEGEDIHVNVGSATFGLSF